MESMKCPHCNVTFAAGDSHYYLNPDKDGNWACIVKSCPVCKKNIVWLEIASPKEPVINGVPPPVKVTRLRVYPKGSSRSVHASVPRDIADDFKEACVVLEDSSKASAALSRRCLQHLLREAAKVKHADLYNEIQELLDRGTLPSSLADSIDAIRHIGNFSAHPTKSKNTGEILPVEPGEAEWNLDVLESLFDFFYVQPELLAKKKDALNKKLQEAGKKPMK